MQYPKPKDQPKDQPPAVRTYAGGREECNLLTKEGRDIYRGRTRQAWERQGGMCCLYGFIPDCPGKLPWAIATLDHEIPRGYGGASRDDRMEIKVRMKDGSTKVRWRNGAAHPQCNIAKGSRRIEYNAAHNGDMTWELIPKTTNSGKVLFRCSGCGRETPAPTKHHVCKTEG